MNTLSNAALFFGFLNLAIALPMLFNQQQFRKHLLKLVSRTANVQLLGLWNFVIGYLMVNAYPWVNKSPAAFIAVFGYLLLLRGLVQLWFPKFISAKSKHLLKNESLMNFAGFFSLVVGLFFGWLGYTVFR